MEFQPTRNQPKLISKPIQRNHDRPLNRVSKFGLPGFGQMGESIGELSEDETKIGFPGQQERTLLFKNAFGIAFFSNQELFRKEVYFILYCRLCIHTTICPYPYICSIIHTSTTQVSSWICASLSPCKIDIFSGRDDNRLRS
jgi:hypothetical protein